MISSLLIDIETELGDYFKFTTVESLGPLISRIIGLVIGLAALLLLLYLIMAGIEWLTSGGEKTSVANAKAKITNAFIGLFIVLAAWAIFALVKYMFGIPGGTSGGPGPSSPVCNAADLGKYNDAGCKDICKKNKNCSGQCRTNKNEYGFTFCECVPGAGQKWLDAGYSRCVSK